VIALAELFAGSAAIEQLVLDHNPVFGSVGSKHAPGTADRFAAAAGTADFLAGVAGSGLTSLSLRGCGAGPTTCSKLAASLPTRGTLSTLVLSCNPVGQPCGPAALKPGEYSSYLRHALTRFRWWLCRADTHPER
jgi:hypothetical protein